jgi:hypothetical protein
MNVCAIVFHSVLLLIVVAAAQGEEGIAPAYWRLDQPVARSTALQYRAPVRLSDHTRVHTATVVEVHLEAHSRVVRPSALLQGWLSSAGWCERLLCARLGAL